MNEKRLSEGGDQVVLADAAKAERKLRQRPRQLPVVGLFLAITFGLAVYWLIVEF